MVRPRRLSQKRGWAFATCVALVKPTLLATTKRRWLGGHHLPATGGCIVAGNHVSHLDPFTLAHFVYDHGRLPRFLAKSELFDLPVAGRLVRNAGQIPVHRMSADAAQAFSAAVAAVEAGECVVVYPEGTITRDPDLWPMTGRSGAARIALTTGCPVVPVAQWGAQDVLAPYAKRPHLFPRRTVTVKAGEPVDLDDLRGAPLTPQVLRTATDRILAAITALVSDVRGEPAPATRFDPKAVGVRPIGNPHRGRPKPSSRNRIGRRRA